MYTCIYIYMYAEFMRIWLRGKNTPAYIHIYTYTYIRAFSAHLCVDICTDMCISKTCILAYRHSQTCLFLQDTHCLVGSQNSRSDISNICILACVHIQNMSLLQDTHWLDPKTRALFVDFVAYSPNTDMFALIR